MPRARAGSSLIELIVALALFELAALTTLQAIVASLRISTHVHAAGLVDQARLESVRSAATDPSCRALSAPTLRAITLPAHPSRPSITVMLRCGP